MNQYHSKEQIINEIDKFLRMSLVLADQVITRQFAYIKSKIDTELTIVGSWPRNEPQIQASIEAYNLMDGLSFNDLCHFYIGDDLPKSFGNKSDALNRLKDRAIKVKNLIETAF